jgi:hypothetical protein
MKRNFALLIILCGSFFLSFGQDNKFTHNLSEYGIELKIDDTKWKRLTYSYMKEEYVKRKADFDDYLNSENFLACFFFIPKDSVLPKDQTSIVIQINTISSPYLLKIYDTIQTTLFSLKALEGGQLDKNTYGKQYFDTHTQSRISKNSTAIYGRGAYPPPNESERHYLIQQVRENGKLRILIEYRCYARDEKDYFPSFEKIIASLR